MSSTLAGSRYTAAGLVTAIFRIATAGWASASSGKPYRWRYSRASRP